MDDPLPQNPYKVLNVPKDASLATIRSAHRKLVLTCHPDKVHDESLKQQKSEQFQQVQHAYEILSNDTSRQRYDDRAKVAELRAEMAAERGSPRMPPDSGRRSGHSPTTEIRGGRRYEERVPSWANDGEHLGSKYQEPRLSKKYEDDSYFLQPSRRSTGRLPDEKRRAREVEEEREQTERIATDRIRRDRDFLKTAKKAVYMERTRERDRDRKRESDTKTRSKFAYAESESESESELEPEFEYRPAKREAIPKRRHEEIPRRSSKRETVDDDDYVPYRVSAAEDYINKASGRSPLERRPTGFDRVSSSYNARAAAPPPPPPPPPPGDAGRRSSERKHRPRESTPPRPSAKDRRLTEIVDPPPTRRPSIPGSSSDPRGLKNLVTPTRREPLRSATVQSVPEAKQPSIRRADTMPTNGSNYRRADTVPSKSSKLKHADLHDSDYSSPETPEYFAEPKKLTKYQILVEENDDGGGYRAVPASKEVREEREISPKNRRGVEHPSLTTRPSPSIKTTPSRSTSYAFTPETQKRPAVSRTESARITPSSNRHSGRGGALYGEVTPDQYKVVHEQPKLRPNDVRYADYSSRDRRNSDETNRDFYSSSHFGPRPGLSRYESSGYENRVH